MERSLRRWGKYGWAGLAIGIALTLGASRQTVEAQSVEVAYASLWQSASFPVENFQAYTGRFGEPRPNGRGGTRPHLGLDIAAPEGSYIRNWWGGRVIEVSDDSACGTSVVIASGSYIHIYCHMMGRVELINGQRAMVDRAGGVVIPEGQVIQTGQRIGRIGMTGRTTGPHLHWGMRYNEQWIDPGAILQAMYSSQSISRR
ncbi:M23 family metallopeptidase [Synechococcus elongatus]|uniref:M23 family metallopeptidase n=2 Tax=Synechococcus elongatus TaxID=32046 RepID=A0AAN1QLQ4_SYNEL|nr:M23 family metallopeptidase [Synechococcus elongatus]AZB71713.1 M23 family peptidase [Synechococcus elongatus PCC 11801]QFZ91391.1 M23 family metallopeptidase [Synechococcus elongatus PCC 11802]